MDWNEIRDHYARLLEQSGRTQEEVARAGGLKKQNLISKLLTNRKQGPIVMTFVHAVLGLGLPLSTFFQQIEDQTNERDLAEPRGVTSPRRVFVSHTHQDTEPLRRFLTAFMTAFEQTYQQELKPPRRPPRARAKRKSAR